LPTSFSKWGGAWKDEITGRGSWYEAQAYAAWWTAERRKAGEMASDEALRLPMVAEWERAAASSEGRTYAWGNEADLWRANTKESGLGRPTPVHMYPAGASPEGVFDLCGNVWEWLADKDSEGNNLTGGTWYGSIESSTAAVRVWYFRYDWFNLGGFRLVVAPISHF
jgi:formylglycine-generating enzyme required for sulfatase activity